MNGGSTLRQQRKSFVFKSQALDHVYGQILCQEIILLHQTGYKFGGSFFAPAALKTVSLLRIVGRAPLINWWGIIKMNHTYTFEHILGGWKARGKKQPNKQLLWKGKTSSVYTDRWDIPSFLHHTMFYLALCWQTKWMAACCWTRRAWPCWTYARISSPRCKNFPFPPDV